MATEEGWQRLAEAIVKRRAEKNLTQVEVANRGPLSLDRVQSLEGAKRTSYRAGTLAALERALDWSAGSVERILEGGDPTLRTGVPYSQKITEEFLLNVLNQISVEDLRHLVAQSLRDREAEADAPWETNPSDPHLRRIVELWPQAVEWQRRAIVGVFEEMVGEAARRPEPQQPEEESRRTG